MPTMCTGSIFKVIYQDKATKWGIFQIRMPSSNFEDLADFIVVTGYIPEYVCGEHFKFVGDMVESAKYGQQLRITQATPYSREAVIDKPGNITSQHGVKIPKKHLLVTKGNKQARMWYEDGLWKYTTEQKAGTMPYEKGVEWLGGVDSIELKSHGLSALTDTARRYRYQLLNDVNGYTFHRGKDGWMPNYAYLPEGTINYSHRLPSINQARKFSEVEGLVAAMFVVEQAKYVRKGKITYSGNKQEPEASLKLDGIHIKYSRYTDLPESVKAPKFLVKTPVGSVAYGEKVDYPVPALQTPTVNSTGQSME